MNVEKIMQEYEQQYRLNSDFTEQIEKLIRDLIKEKNIKVQSIPSRIKKSESLKKKLDRADGKYSKLSDVTDISGIRIITYFSDDVDAVAKVIEEEFDIDKEYSVDKRALLDPDRFGYLSLHYVAKLPNSRLQLTEYKRFSGCNVEIQIRSILQHTWAEVEHDLGYKTKESVPKNIRRRFSRLAGLLEIADSEFVEIRDSLQEYKIKVPEQILENSASVLIDQASLLAFIENSTLVQELDQNIATITKINILGTDDTIVSNLKHVGLETIADIESALREFGEFAVKLAVKWLKGSSRGSHINSGICLFYLCYILADHTGSLKDYLRTFKIGYSDKRLDEIAEDIISVCNQDDT